MYVVEESHNEWNRNKTDIQNRRNSLQNSIDRTKAKGAKKGWSAEKFDEAAAFQAQYAYDPSTIKSLNPSVKVSSIAAITPGFVRGIRVVNSYPYASGGEYNVASGMVRIDSPIVQLLIVFPNNIGYISFVNNHRYITQLPNIYYKK